MLGANTLEMLATLYTHPPSDFRRLNPGWKSGEPLPEGTRIGVSDPAFAPLVAARLAARALVAHSLPTAERVRLIQSMVPVAATNPTALDSVLSRLLLAAKPLDPTALRSLDRIAQAHVGG